MHACLNWAYTQLRLPAALLWNHFKTMPSWIECAVQCSMPRVILGQVKATTRYFSRYSAARHLETATKLHLEGRAM